LIIMFVCLAGVGAYALSLSEAQLDYLSGNYEEARRKAERLRADEDVLYFLGVVNSKIGEYQQARRYLRKLCKYYPGSRLCSQAMLKIADTYFLEKDYERAHDYYRQLQQRHPSFDNMPTVLLRLAQIASRKGQWDEKNKYLKIIKQKFPQSSESRYASILEDYGDFFTVQVGAFSERKNAFVLYNELSKKYKPYIVTDKRTDGMLYKVRVGKYKLRYEAEKISRMLLNEGYPARIYP